MWTMSTVCFFPHTHTWSRSINNFSFSSSPSKAVKWVKKQQNNPVEWPAIFSQSWWSFHYNIHSSSSLLIGHFHSYIIVFDCQFRYCLVVNIIIDYKLIRFYCHIGVPISLRQYWQRRAFLGPIKMIMSSLWS